MNGQEVCELDPLIQVLKEEPGLKGNCLRIIEDLILFAVEDGKQLRILLLLIFIRSKVTILSICVSSIQFLSLVYKLQILSQLVFKHN